MDNQNQQLSSPLLMRIRQTAVLRAVWLLLFVLAVGLLFIAVPSRYEMLVADVYGFGEGLAEIGVSLHFFAVYFIFWELVFMIGALLVAGIIGWRKADDPYALLVAILLTLLGFVLPLFDGLPLITPFWLWPILAFRFLAMVCFMAVVCLFPNGRFQPKWIRWVLVGWIMTLSVGLWIKPDILADTAILPNTRTLADASFPLVGVFWFLTAIAGQIVRFRRLSNRAERQQTKWVLLGFIAMVLFTLISTLLLISVPLFRDNARGEALFILVMGALYLLSALLLPITIAFAMLRYRLWEVDIFINRTLVYGGVTVLITAVYILLVGGVGAFTSSQSGQMAGVFVATLVIIVLVAPVKRTLQKNIDRFVPKPSKLETAGSVSDQTIIQGRAHHLAQLFWLGMLLMGLLMFAVSTAIILSQDLWQSIIDGTYPIDIALLPKITGPFTPAIWVISYAQMAAFVLVGLILFWRKSADRMGILASLMLITVGLGFTANIILLPIFASSWHVVVTIYQAVMFGSIVLFLFWFPDGRFHPNWTKLVTVAWFVYAALWIIWPELNPHRAASIWPVAIWMTWVWLGVLAQFWRYRHRSDTIERQQTKWVITGFIGANISLFVIIMLFATGALASANNIVGLLSSVLFLFAGLGTLLIPIAISIALFRYRLWEIDFFVNRTLVFGGLTAMILLIYALLVGGLSLLFQAQNSLLISLLATGLIAVLFQPIRARLQHGVNRLMFGERDDPYVVLSRLGRQLRETAVPNQTLPAITATITQTLKLPYAAIELTTANGERQTAATSGQKTAVVEEWPLVYQGEIVGRLQVAPRTPGETFTNKERQLLVDIATQAGAAAYSVRLTVALQKSRERLVLAREEERRRIRRDLHDELGPSLASQTFTLDTVIDLLQSDPQAAADLLQSLKSQNQTLVSNIRRLVYELRPPALDDLGLMDALQAHLSQVEQPHMIITAVPDPLPALPAAIEVAAYRIVLEATTNVVRHAQAQACAIQLKAADARLTLTISDDGVGLPAQRQNGVGLTSMRERAEELGGVLLVRNLADGGVQITAVLPLK